MIGSLCVIVGLAFSTMYVYGAVIARWGEANQSLLFWHLPILFLGIFSIIFGLVLSFWGINRFRSDNPPPNPRSKGYQEKYGINHTIFQTEFDTDHASDLLYNQTGQFKNSSL
jgi:hypothetical protein